MQQPNPHRPPNDELKTTLEDLGTEYMDLCNKETELFQLWQRLQKEEAVLSSAMAHVEASSSVSNNSNNNRNNSRQAMKRLEEALMQEDDSSTTSSSSSEH
jgi:hypothetical protein